MVSFSLGSSFSSLDYYLQNLNDALDVLNVLANTSGLYQVEELRYPISRRTFWISGVSGISIVSACLLIVSIIRDVIDVLAKTPWVYIHLPLL